MMLFTSPDLVIMYTTDISPVMTGSAGEKKQTQVALRTKLPDYVRSPCWKSWKKPRALWLYLFQLRRAELYPDKLDKIIKLSDFAG